MKEVTIFLFDENSVNKVTLKSTPIGIFFDDILIRHDYMPDLYGYVRDENTDDERVMWAGRIDDILDWDKYEWLCCDDILEITAIISHRMWNNKPIPRQLSIYRPDEEEWQELWVTDGAVVKLDDVHVHTDPMKFDVQEEILESMI